MSQQRNVTAVVEPLTAHNAIDAERILDAAYPLFLAIGPRRLTMADVARHAGVSRATLYRRWPNVRSLAGALVTREWSRIAADAEGKHTGDGRARLVRSIVSMAARLRAHPLLRTIVDSDPEFLLPYLLERRGTSTEHALALLVAGIRAGQADGSIRRGTAAILAQAVLLTATSFVLSAPAMAGDERTLARLDRELAAIVDRYLAP